MPRAKLTEAGQLRNRLETYAKKTDRRLDEVEDVVKPLPDIVRLVYGDDTRPESGGLRDLIMDAIKRADETEVQRKKDRKAEEEAAEKMLADVQRLLKQGEQRKGRWAMIRELGTLILVSAAAWDIISSIIDKHHLFGR